MVSCECKILATGLTCEKKIVSKTFKYKISVPGNRKRSMLIDG